MSESMMFAPEASPALIIEASHTPDALAAASGVYISYAGSAMLSEGSFPLLKNEEWVWLTVESGTAMIEDGLEQYLLTQSDAVTLPVHSEGLAIHAEKETRIWWFSVSGTLSDAFMNRLGALDRHITKQSALPSQMNLARHIVQATVRNQSVQESSSAQLQQLLWAMLASHAGQPVALEAVLSHEVAKVVDAMRQNQYKDCLTLSAMAALSRMPVETFRKRFAAEVGMPPQSYQLYCKMERAKALLREGATVRAAGIAVGMNDPYHFSKAFKNVVGMSPSAYSRTVHQ